MSFGGMLEHPEIGWIERTGYPSWMQKDDCCEDDCSEEEEDDREDCD